MLYFSTIFASGENNSKKGDEALLARLGPPYMAKCHDQPLARDQGGQVPELKSEMAELRKNVNVSITKICAFRRRLKVTLQSDCRTDRDRVVHREIRDNKECSLHKRDAGH